jgi:hypothetical protein
LAESRARHTAEYFTALRERLGIPDGDIPDGGTTDDGTPGRAA